MEYPESMAPIPGEEKVIEVDISKLYAFKNHPFRVADDKQMEDLRDSISKFGIMNPLIVNLRNCRNMLYKHRFSLELVKEVKKHVISNCRKTKCVQIYC